MDTTVLLIIAGIITLLSIILKFVKITKENSSIFLDVKKRSDLIEQILSRNENPEIVKNPPLKHFRLAISDWFSVISIVLVSALLLHDYLRIDLFAFVTFFKIGILFSLLLFSIIILALSIIERRLGYWIYEFMSIVEHILELIRLNESKAEQMKAEVRVARAPSRTKKRTAGGKKK